MKRLALLLLLAFLALALWLVARGGRAGDPVERLIADMVPIPGQDFLMGKYEVTQAQWEAVMGENPSYFKGADHPVENVSWDDCQAFLEKLNAHPAARASGLVFRLPTEEEWETACRAGSTNAYRRSQSSRGLPRLWAGLFDPGNPEAPGTQRERARTGRSGVPREERFGRDGSADAAVRFVRR